MQSKYTMTLTAPDGTESKAKLPRGAAWAAARGIVEHSHYDVVLHGEFGDASFNCDGSGKVAWNDKSTTPGEVTKFGKNTVVAI